MYQLNQYGVTRLSDNAHIPEDHGNRDWKEYQTWLLEGNKPESIPGPSAATLRTQRIVANNTAYEAATKALTADYPQLEKDTWPTQNEQAAAWVTDPENAVTPWIDRAAAERGIEREEYLRRTLIKAEQFKILSSFLTGRRQRYEDQIKAGLEPVLDYALTVEVQVALYEVAQTVMNTTPASMKAALA